MGSMTTRSTSLFTYLLRAAN